MAPHLVPLHPLEDEQEYTVQVHIWLSAVTSANYKGPKKRLDRKTTEDSRKLREKSSWATTLPRGSTAGGHWRAATCKLREEGGDICNLSIYLDDLMLFRTIKVHRLHHTDIRPADVSLFSKKNCLAIDVFEQQQHERVYLSFHDPEICASWLCLMRAFSTFELYGRWANPEDGGLYRLWRQLELTVTQARNLGQPPPLTNQAPGGTASLNNFNGRDQATDSDQETMSPDVDIFCEVWLNGLLCARTSAKKDSVGGREWHETYTFPDLPPFDKLEVVVWQQQEASKSGKSAVLGKVKIPLATFRRGEAVDGRYPVLKSGPLAGDLRVGEMRLKIKVDEEIVMPQSVYQPLLEIIRERNFVEWLLDLETNWGVKTIAPSLISVALHDNKLIDEIIEYSTDHIPAAIMASKQTLFRANDVFSKTMETCLGHYGRSFLEVSVGPVIRRICSEGVAIEVDPIRITSKSARGMEKSMETLVYWCGEFWNQIYSSRNECPNELRSLFGHIRATIMQSSQTSINSLLNWQGISAFCFLRFIVPAILHPHLWGLWNGMPSPPIMRTLKLISKVILSLSNLNPSTLKEDFMKGMQPFLVDRISAMEDYLRTISTPAPPQNFYSTPAGTHERDEHVKMIAGVVSQQRSRIPNLGRESVPTLPHLLDLSRNLAVITSTVLHSTDTSKLTQDSPPLGNELSKLIAGCFQVEEEAKARVKELAMATTASKPNSPLARPPLTVTSNLPSPTMVTSPPLPSQRPVKGKRPSTAPASESDSDASRKRLEFTTAHMPAAQFSAFEESRQKRRHLARTASVESFTVHSTSSAIGVQLSKSRSAMPLDDIKRKKGGIRRFLFGSGK